MTRPFLERRQDTESRGIREYNERLILHAIRQHGEIPSADLVRETGLSVQSVSRITKRLIDLDLIEKRDRRRVKGKVGQPSVPLALNPDGAFSIGVKIGRKSLDILSVDFSGSVRETAQFEYEYPDPDEVVATAIDGVGTILAGLSKAQRARVVGVGVVAPYGLADRNVELKSPVALAEKWAKVNVKRAISDAHNISVWEDHDAKAACLADLLLHRADARPRNYLFLFLGTIMSGGVVVDGTLMRGPHGYAGAVGPLPVPAILCPLETLETELTVPLLSVASRYVLNEMLLAAGEDPRTIFTGDLPLDHEVVKEWIDRTAKALSIAIVSAISTIDFEAIVVDGDLPDDIHARLLERISENLETLDFTGLVRPKVIEGNLGRRARALGGAMLPFYSNFAPELDLLVNSTPGNFVTQ